MFWFLKEVEKQTGKKLCDLVSNQYHDKTNLNPAHSVTYLLVLMKQLTVRDKHNYMNNRKKGFFCFSFNNSTTEGFLYFTLFLENEVQIYKNNYRMMFSVSKQVHLIKNKPDPAKN